MSSPTDPVRQARELRDIQDQLRALRAAFQNHRAASQDDYSRLHERVLAIRNALERDLEALEERVYRLEDEARPPDQRQHRRGHPR